MNSFYFITHGDLKAANVFECGTVQHLLKVLHVQDVNNIKHSVADHKCLVGVAEMGF